MANAFYNLAIREMISTEGLSWSDITGERAFDLYGIDTGSYTFDPLHTTLDNVPVIARHPPFRMDTFINPLPAFADAFDVTNYPIDTGKDLNAFIIVREHITLTTRLVAYIDTAPGLPILLTSGVDRVDVQWDPNGIFSFM